MQHESSWFQGPLEVQATGACLHDAAELDGANKARAFGFPANLHSCWVLNASLNRNIACYSVPEAFWAGLAVNVCQGVFTSLLAVLQTPTGLLVSASHTLNALTRSHICCAGVAMGLGLPPTTFETEGATTAESSYWVARAIHYPPLPESSPFVLTRSSAGAVALVCCCMLSRAS